MTKEIEKLHQTYYDLSATIAEKFLCLWDDIDAVKFEGSYWKDGARIFPKSVRFFNGVVRVLVYEDEAEDVFIKPDNEFTTGEMLDVLTCLR